MYALRIGNSSGGWTEFPLSSPAARPELLKISPDGCLKEDERYQLRLVTDSPERICDISVVVNGEEVARGLSEDRISYRNSDGQLLYVYAPTSLVTSGSDGQILLLIYGFARIEACLTFSSNAVINLESDDIPILVRGDREEEEARVQGMFDALFSAPPSQPLQWMLTGTPSYEERFSIIEGGTTSPASRSVSTFLQVTNQVLLGFEHLLPSFRSHVRSSISEIPTRVPGNKVRMASAREAHWIASHPDVLQRSRVDSGIKLGSGFYMPRYVQTEQRARSYNTYENRTIVSFLSACGQRLSRLSSLIESERSLSESVERALNPFSVDGYVFSSLLIASSGHRRGQAIRDRAEALRKKVAALEHAYELAAPGVETEMFLPPRRSKVFQEVVPYTQLYELMMRWCTMGDLDMRGSLLALRTARMDRFYEYYVLLSILSKLDEHGFRPSEAIGSPIGVVEYSLANTSRFFRNEKQVANRFVLEGETGTVTLYYQPVIYGDRREENGIVLHRTSVGAAGYDSYYTPDFLLVFNCKSGTKTVVIDAKYRYTRDVMGSRQENEFQKCLRKYRQEVSGYSGPPNAVWLFCGRDTEVEALFWEQSSWSQSAEEFIRSGAMTLAPIGNELNSLFEAIGIIQQSSEQNTSESLQENPTEAPQPNFNIEKEDFSIEADEGDGKGRTNAKLVEIVNAGVDIEPAEYPNDNVGSTGDTEASKSEALRTLSEIPEEEVRDSVEADSEEAAHVMASPIPGQTAGAPEESELRGEPKDTPKAEVTSKHGRVSRKESMGVPERLVEQLYELLGQNNRMLFDDGWSRTSIKMGRPILRHSMPTGREANRYVSITLDGDEVYLAKDWSPLNVNMASMLIKRLSKP